MEIGECIKKLRQYKRMTQEEMAELLKVSVQTVSRWENNLNYPDLIMLPELASLFHVTTDYLLGDAQPADIIRDPYVFEFLGIPENKPYLENDLEQALVMQIEKFLLELGRGFMFVGTQQRITLNNTYYYVAEVNAHDDNPPIGIILCTDKDGVAAEYVLGGLSNNIFASRYVLYIPDKEQMVAQVDAVLKKWHDKNDGNQ